MKNLFPQLDQSTFFNGLLLMMLAIILTLEAIQMVNQMNFSRQLHTHLETTQQVQEKVAAYLQIRLEAQQTQSDLQEALTRPRSAIPDTPKYKAIERQLLEGPKPGQSSYTPEPTYYPQN
jgi:cell division protein FtsL